MENREKIELDKGFTIKKTNSQLEIYSHDRNHNVPLKHGQSIELMCVKSDETKEFRWLIIDFNEVKDEV